jgi:hypothetical protein
LQVPALQVEPGFWIFMMSACACGMDAAARTAAAEIPTKMLEARFIEFMEIPPLQERNRD